MRASGYERHADDWYVEPRWLVDALLDVEPFEGLCWDPSCGGGNIPNAIRARGLECFGSDIVQRGAAEFVGDFLDSGWPCGAQNIITNPPYGVIQQYVDVALKRAEKKVAVLARLAFLEGQARREWFRKAPLARVWVSSRRPSMPPGGSNIPAKGGSIAYAWFVFEHGYCDAPTVGWV